MSGALLSALWVLWFHNDTLQREQGLGELKSLRIEALTKNHWSGHTGAGPSGSQISLSELLFLAFKIFYDDEQSKPRQYSVS